MKTIIFDFDGTLSYNSINVWRAVWQKLGYSTEGGELFQTYHKQFMSGLLSHQEWCDRTCEALKQKGMNREDLEIVARKLNIIEGFDKTIAKLKAKGWSIHIVSGCVKQAIEMALGKKINYFTNVSANVMKFGEDNKLVKIIGTNFDFEGKAEYVRKLKDYFGTRPEEVVFVGNSSNDEWVKKTGARVLCINPRHTDFSDKKKWDTVIEECTDLSQILPFVFSSKEKNCTL